MIDATTFIRTAQHFYQALARDNTRLWWQNNRGTYDTALKPAAEALLAALSPPLSQRADAPIKTKLFRPHRDVRSSKDKSPYNTHLHMMWQIAGEGRQNPVFFFGIGQDYVTVGAGIMGLEKSMLEDWRKFVDLDTKRITAILDAVAAHGYPLRAPDLKRVPPAYDKDHPAAHLLRMKSIVASRDLRPDTKDLPKALRQAFTALWPLNALLIQISES